MKITAIEDLHCAIKAGETNCVAVVRQYIARDFHPSRNPTDRIAGEWFAARGMSLPGVTTEAA